MENYYSSLANNFSDEELLVMAYQFDRWDNEMIAAVENELLTRKILPDDILRKKQKLIEDEDEILTIGREATFPQQFLGWIGILAILGLIIGYELAFAKTKSIYTGKEYLKYDETSRESGRYMFFISLAIVIGFTLYKAANFIERY